MLLSFNIFGVITSRLVCKKAVIFLVCYVTSVNYSGIDFIRQGSVKFFLCNQVSCVVLQGVPRGYRFLEVGGRVCRDDCDERRYERSESQKGLG